MIIENSTLFILMQISHYAMTIKYKFANATDTQ